jgi:hypothetical protein
MPGIIEPESIILVGGLPDGVGESFEAGKKFIFQLRFHRSSIRMSRVWPERILRWWPARRDYTSAAGRSLVQGVLSLVMSLPGIARMRPRFSDAISGRTGLGANFPAVSQNSLPSPIFRSISGRSAGKRRGCESTAPTDRYPAVSSKDGRPLVALPNRFVQSWHHETMETVRMAGTVPLHPARPTARAARRAISQPPKCLFQASTISCK